MRDAPSGILAAAAVTAISLAKLTGAALAGVPLPSGAALMAQGACRRIAVIDAPRLAGPDDVAAIGASLIQTVQDAARAASPRDVSVALYALAQASSLASPASASPILTELYASARSLAASVEVAALGEAFLAEARTEFGDRRAATDARERIIAAMDQNGDRIAAALGQEVFGVLSTAARECSTHLVTRAATLQPVVRVEAGRSAPSTALAWALYQDPARAEELVLRNRVGTPLFMPSTIEALAPASER